MPFINGKFHMNPSYGRAVESARGAQLGSESHEDEQNRDPHWVTINGRHVFIHEEQGRAQAD